MIGSSSTIHNFSSHIGTGSSCEDELEYDRISFFTSSAVAGLRLQNLTPVNKWQRFCTSFNSESKI